MKFLFKREWLVLKDPGLASLSKFMMVFIVIYTFGFLTLFLSLPLGYAP